MLLGRHQEGERGEERNPLLAARGKSSVPHHVSVTAAQPQKHQGWEKRSKEHLQAGWEGVEGGRELPDPCPRRTAPFLTHVRCGTGAP